MREPMHDSAELATREGGSLDSDLFAGEFSSWLDRSSMAQREHLGSEVPCDGCTACCTSSHFVHIGPDETETLARVSSELLFPAPGRPEGNVLLGYDENGHCPMLDAGTSETGRPYFVMEHVSGVPKTHSPPGWTGPNSK